MASRNGIFIGLGGTGISTVAHLKAKILNDSEYEGDLNRMLFENEFIFLDTDENTKKRINEDNDINKYFRNSNPIPNTQFINLGETIPFKTYSVAKNTKKEKNDKQRLIEWAIDPQLAKFQLPTRELHSGAGAQRMAGRTAIFDKSPFIIDKITSALERMREIDGNNGNDAHQRPTIWVFASANGGTGSSAVLDILYFADRIYRNMFNGADPYLKLVLFMPGPFIDKNKNNPVYPLSAFSTFWELNAFRYDAMNDNDGKKFKHFSCIPDIGAWDAISAGWKTYSYLIPIDTKTDKNQFVELDDIFVHTAEMCFYLHKGSIGNTLASNLDNDLLNEDFIKNPVSVTNSPFEWTRSLIALGYKAICKPDNLLKEYIKTRFLYDLVDYGLLGFEFIEIHKNVSEQEKAKKEFGDNFIFKYLTDTDNFEAGKESLQQNYKELFSKVKVQVFEKDPTKEEWASIFSTFKSQITQVSQSIDNSFSTKGDALSKEFLLSKIKKDLNNGVDKSIINYGLLYTNHLIYLVDDKYCEFEAVKLKERIPTDAQINNLEVSIQNLISTGDRKKELPHLQKLLNNYKAAIFEKCLYINTIKVLTDLTPDRTGYLEILRNGSNTAKGLSDLKNQIDILITQFSEQYRLLAKRFKATKEEVFTTYVPTVYDFPGDTKSWKDKHFFQDLYGDFLPLDDSRGALRKGNGDLGYPPLRDNNNNQGLSVVLKEILKEFPETFFSDLSIGENVSKKTNLNNFIISAEEFINKKMSDPNCKISQWISQSLENVFTEVYRDRESLIRFKEHFSASIPVLYSRKQLSATVQEKTLYAGVSPEFAESLGYQPGPESQFIEDQMLSNRLYVFKVEVGHNLYDYSRFDEIANAYTKEKVAIEDFQWGCHIHKDFAKLDLNEILSYKISSPLADFFKLSYLDEFFSLLYSNENALYNSIFINNGSVSSGSRFIKSASTASIYKKIVSITKVGNNLTLVVQKLGNQSGRINYTIQDQKILTNIDCFTAISVQMGETQCSYFTQLNQIESIVRTLPPVAQEKVKDLLIKWHEDILTNLSTNYVDLFSYYNEYLSDDAKILADIESKLLEMNKFFN